jgi:hypothetical protein
MLQKRCVENWLENNSGFYLQKMAIGSGGGNLLGFSVQC